MGKQHSFLSGIGIAAIIMAGCGTTLAEASEEPLTVEPTIEATPEPTGLPSETPTEAPTSLPTLTPTLIPTPSFGDALIGGKLLEGETDDCQLPCWRGLRVGVSNRDDVQAVLTEILNPPQGYDFFAPSVEAITIRDQLLDIPDTYSGGQTWYIDDPNGSIGNYYFYAVMDKETDLLLGIVEDMSAFGQYDVPSLAEVLNQLGKPDWIYGGAHENTSYDVALFYKQGIAAYVSIALIPSWQPDTDITYPICLNNEPFQVFISFIDPYTSLEESNLSPIQKAWGAPDDPPPHIDEELGASIEDYIEFVNSDPCFDVTFD